MKNAGGMERVLSAVSSHNRDTAKYADLYAEHRTRTTALLLGAASTGARLAVLGAGNANDLDLPALLDAYAEVHLVDLDRGALDRARSRVASAERARVHLHGGVDLSGHAAELGRWRKQVPPLARLEAALPTRLAELAGALPGPFDVVASTCLVTQLSWQVAEVLGREHPDVVLAQQIVLRFHWRAMAALLAPAGTALLVTDFVSNETFPLEDLPADEDLAALASDLVRQDNCLRGGDPLLHRAILSSDRELRARFARPEEVIPWLWHAAPERWYLVRGWRVSAS